MKRIYSIPLVFAFFTIGLSACTNYETVREEKLRMKLNQLDELLKEKQVSVSDLASTVVELRSNFRNSSDTSINDSIGTAQIRFYWNSDSSIAMILSTKKDKHWFKRETIVHINDSILFINRFLVGESVDTTGLTFMEFYDYTTPARTIRNLGKLKVLPDLRDSVSFKEIPFNDHTQTIDKHYSFELEYSQNIVNSN
jgi:hypothetical protein